MKKLKPVLNTLTFLFPLYPTLLLLYPIFLGIFIDYDLFDSRSLAINLVWIPLFTLPAILTQNKYILRVSTLLFFLIGLIETCHWLILGGPITITSLLVISNTYYDEIVEFASLKASSEFLLILPFFTIFILSFKNPPPFIRTKTKNYTLLIIGLISVIFISENAINGRLIRKGSPHLIKVAYSFIEKISLFKEAMKDAKPKELEATSIIPNEKQTFVLILGESNSRRHMSLYGAKSKTTPKLDNRTDLILYNNVVSPYSSTINSVLTILTQTNLEKKIDILNNIDILDIFHSSGFKNFWISNQSPIGVWDNQITQFARKSDKCEFVNMTSNSSYEATYTASYDEKIIAPFSEALKDSAKKKLIILHLIGNHSSYSKRYPTDFNIFEGDGSKKSNTIAEYKNSLVYTDFIVDSMINVLMKTQRLNINTATSLLYISDHGENVYDHGEKAGHDYSKVVPKANVEIPFFLWVSSYFQSLDSSKTQQAILNKNKPFVTDDLFHALIDLNFIKTKFLEKDRSLFNAKFNDKRKRILCDGKDYDEKVD